MSLSVIANVTASTKRPPAMSGGKRGAAAANLTAVLIVPLAPVDLELAQRLELGTPYELKQTVAYNETDILEGDILTVAGVDYPIRYVGEYDYPTVDSIRRLHLIIEDLKRA